MAGTDLTYPFILQGPIDFGQYRLRGLRQFSGVVFASAFATLQDAIDSLPVTGGAVILEPKTYALTTTLDMSKTDTLNNVVLIGHGQVTTIQAASTFVGSPLIKMSNASGAKRTFMGIFNCTIDVNSKTTGVSMANTSDSWCKNLEFQNTGGTTQQYYITIDSATRGIIAGCEFYDSLGSISYNIYRASGTAAPADSHWKIYSNYIYSGYDSGGGIVLINCPEYSLICNNTILTQADGIYLSSTSASNLVYINVSGNVISGYSDIAPCERAITLETNTGLSRHTVVTDNMIKWADTGIYIHAPTTGAAIRYCNIAGNSILRTGGSGILLEGWVYHIDVVGNSIYMLNTLGGTNGGVYLYPNGATTYRHIGVVGNNVINLGTSALTNGILANDLNITKSLVAYNFVKGTLGISVSVGVLESANTVDATLESAQ
jgi:hypothetical protein